MRILHLCLAAFYIDNYGYQENLLPRMHKRQGHIVQIIASTETLFNNLELGYVDAGEYRNEDDIVVKRLDYLGIFPKRIIRKVRIYKNLYQEIALFNPDFIFVHDLQFVSIQKVKKYALHNRSVRIVIDGHTDFYNSAKNVVSREILHRIIYKWCAKQIEPFTESFFGTLPARVAFFTDMYGMPKEKCHLLVMGADDDLVKIAMEEDSKCKVRLRYGINGNDFIIITGGKFDLKKQQILNLIRAVKRLNNDNVHIIIFGSQSPEMKKLMDHESQDMKNYQYVGWLDVLDTYSLLAVADLAVFPALHSTLWEQSVGQGIPCVFNDLEGVHHLQLGGNCVYVNTHEEDELYRTIKELVDDPIKLISMRDIAQSKGMEVFSYYRIAEQSLL